MNRANPPLPIGPALAIAPMPPDAPLQPPESKPETPKAKGEDIVKRLRAFFTMGGGPVRLTREHANEAADEIDRLRGALCTSCEHKAFQPPSPRPPGWLPPGMHSTQVTASQLHNLRFTRSEYEALLEARDMGWRAYLNSLPATKDQAR